MKLNTYSVRDCYAVLAVVTLLILTATGNAFAMLLFSCIALTIWFAIDGFGR